MCQYPWAETGLEEKETVLTGNRRRRGRKRGSFDESASKWVGQVRSLGGQQPKVERIRL